MYIFILQSNVEQLEHQIESHKKKVKNLKEEVEATKIATLPKVIFVYPFYRFNELK